MDFLLERKAFVDSVGSQGSQAYRVTLLFVVQVKRPQKLVWPVVVLGCLTLA